LASRIASTGTRPISGCNAAIIRASPAWRGAMIRIAS
jgi:hypothetical protein